MIIGIKILGYSFAVLALLGILWTSITDEKEWTAYCKVDNFIENKFTNLADCDFFLSSRKDKNTICGCKRTDGPFSIINSAAELIFK